MPATLAFSLKQARRLALAAQGFNGRQPPTVKAPHLNRLIERLGLLQIDSVNAVVRSHYLPLFSRLGSYSSDLLDQAAWSSGRRRTLFEYWGHEASLLPLSMFAWMAQASTLGVVGAAVVLACVAGGISAVAASATAEQFPGEGRLSGLALGVDAAAHRGALAAGSGGSPGGGTVAVIGTGIDRIYPARNAALAREIAASGAIVSEFPLGTPPLPHNFPRRNRIIAGLVEGVLVVEAALNSGSLITARLATENGREVFAIPGSIHSPLARGCHRLIRDGAKLVETAEDVIEELRGRLGWPTPAAEPKGRRRQAGRDAASGAGAASPPAQQTVPGLDDEAARVLHIIGHDPVDIDTLAGRCGLTVDALYAILLPLELDGHLARLPGGRLQRT
mgnify:CR=1 FL=1